MNIPWSTRDFHGRCQRLKQFFLANCEAIALGRRNKEIAYQTFRRHMKIDEPRLLDFTYKVQFVEAIPSKPYPREDAIQASIDDLRGTVPKLDGMKLADFLDNSLIRELDKQPRRLSRYVCHKLSMIGPLLLASAVNRTPAARLGNRSLKVAPQGVYRCAGTDDWCAISVQNDSQWQALISVIEDANWGSESRFATVTGRQQHHDEIDEHIQTWTQRFPHVEVEARLKKHGVNAERVRRIDDVMSQPGGATVFHEMTEPRVGSMLTTGLPFNFSAGRSPNLTQRPVSAPTPRRSCTNG